MQGVGTVTGFFLQRAMQMRDAEVAKWMEVDGVFERSVAIQDEAGARGVVRVIQRRSKSKALQ